MRPAFSAAVAAFQAVTRVRGAACRSCDRPWRGLADDFKREGRRNVAGAGSLSAGWGSNGTTDSAAASGLWSIAAAIAGGLAAGVGAAHLLYTRGHKFGLELRAARARKSCRRARRRPRISRPEGARSRPAGRTARAYSAQGLGRHLLAGRRRLFGDRVGFVAGGVTFFTMLSLFPTLAAFVTVYGLFADPADDAGAAAVSLFGLACGGGRSSSSGEMQRLAENSNSAADLHPDVDPGPVAVDGERRDQGALLWP